MENKSFIPSSLECVIFDMDGTLTQTNKLIFASFNHVSEKYLGRTLTDAQIIGLFGPPEEGGIATLLGGANLTAAMDDLCTFYATHHAQLAKLHDGIQATLQFLKDRGLVLALFTGKGNRTTAITMEQFHLTPYFDLVVSGTDVRNHKPHPEGINRIVQTLSVSRDRVLMVGDSPSDFAAARSANVSMAAVLWDSYDRERLLQQPVDYAFHTVSEMADWFRSHLH